ncbi:MAG TPA: protein-L-isoaspartate(D-aspartate) O-methyltransferase [Actinomycetota bacterium]|nr:protein-L-isoaspartate(D-aspartate) O-methyltransferase [Actinomycetota bacterium]
MATPPRSPETLVRVIEREGVGDRRVLDAFRRVPRNRFVPPEWEERAYEDRPIPIPHGQVTTQPSLIARMVAGLRLEGHERVLEVGTGLGFQTAILAVLAREVFSIERFPDLAEWARRNLEAAGFAGVTVVVGDGTKGLPERAPFDATVVSAAAPAVPGPLVEQLAEGGRLVHPLGPGGDETVIAYRKDQGRLVEKARLTPATFVPLVGEHGLPEDRSHGR